MNRTLIGYALLFFSLIVLDQSTKWHSEKSYLQHSNAQNSEVYQAGHRLVFGLGNTPGEINAAHAECKVEADIPSPTKNWLEFNLTYLRNHGAVWGIFSTMPTVARLGLFYSVTLVAVIGVVYLFRKTPPENRIYRTALVFILSGALGNFIDRLTLQYVVDWIHFQWTIFGWEYSFPVFNVADISIDVGIVLMLLDMIFSERHQRAKARESSHSAQPAVT